MPACLYTVDRCDDDWVVLFCPDFVKSFLMFGPFRSPDAASGEFKQTQLVGRDVVYVHPCVFHAYLENKRIAVEQLADSLQIDRHHIFYLHDLYLHGIGDDHEPEVQRIAPLLELLIIDTPPKEQLSLWEVIT